MRYYSITITPKNGSPVTFSTLNSNGNVNGQALQVDIDIFQTYFHQPAQIASVIIYGVDFKDLNQGANWNEAAITVSVGMSPGLPFANALQAGQIINGTVYQAFGNWQGNDVNLNLLIIPSTINPDDDVNLTFNWIKGTTLESAVKTSLGIAYPQLQIFGGFSPNLIYTETQPAQYIKLKTFSQYVNSVSKQIIIDPNYLGASISVISGGFNLIDGTIPSSKTTNVDFIDMVGNLTWLNIATIQAKLVMRADLNIGDNIVFPKGAPAVNTAVSFNQIRNLTSFDGKFLINKIRHVGSSRHPDANAWVTIVDCVIPGAIN